MTDLAADARREAARLRMAKTRERRRAQRMVVAVEVDRYAVPDFLIEQGHLAEWDNADPIAIGNAISDHLDTLVARNRFDDSDCGTDDDDD